MFGKNPVRHQDFGDGKVLRVQEIFATIQGEGPHTGRPAVFIRMAGCNLRCHFCDTDFESNYHRSITLSQIMEKVRAVTTDLTLPLVVITGGEPLLQNIYPLIDLLWRSSYDVQIETNGTVWLEEFDSIDGLDLDFFVCSPKTPKVHPKIERNCAHWKYIITAGEVSEEDGLPVTLTQINSKAANSALFRPDSRAFHTIWVQPLDAGHLCPAQNEANVNAAIASAMKYGYRLSVQIHKLVGLP